MKIGHYEIQAELGAGGMGTVYKGIDTRTDQIVAIKQLHANLADAELIERFKREGEALRDLNHPNIVKMLDAVEEDGNHYLVMEYVPGGDLSNLLQVEKLALEKILNIAIDLADALTRAHRLNIIHRDLKPANILIGHDGVLRLTDFGVAHVGSKVRVTETDAIIGTVDYLPPESFAGGMFDEHGDIWAFGVILFEMVAGMRPFSGDSMVETIYQITTAEPPDLEALSSDTPLDLVDLIYRMLERSPEARVRSVRQIGLELEDILQGRITQIAVPARFDTIESDIFVVKKHNLPVQTTPFVGRDPELGELSRLINDASIRLMTIIAPGGMGKTRLSLEAAQRALNVFEDGVYFVELAPLTLPNQIVPAIGTALDYKFLHGEGNAQQELIEFLVNKQILLVMDNFEHLLEGAEVVEEILAKTNNIQILVTSRQRLAQSGENILHLSGMDFPDWETPEDALQYASVKLFINSAKRVSPAFALTVDNLDYVARICKLVQGMPLGIVLAGAWSEMLSPQEIADELEHSLDILSDELGELPARQQSIRVVMDYAWQMMTEPEQAVFMKLSVFKGGFTREAAQAVADANLRTLMSLVTKSLIRRETNSGRYEIHELLRQYAYEKLETSGNLDTTFEKHAMYFSQFLAQQLPLLKGGGQMKALADIDIDYENCHAAWAWSAEHNKSLLINTMIDSLHLFFHFHYLYDAGYKIFELARQKWSFVFDSPEPIAGRLSVRFIGTEDREIVQPIVEKNLAFAEQHKQLAEIAFCKRELGRLFAHHSDDREFILQGIEYFEVSMNLYRQLGDSYFEALILDDIGYAYHRIGEFQKRIDYSGQSLELRKAIGDMLGYGDCLNGYVTSLFPSGLEKPLELLKQARELAFETKNSYLLTTVTPLVGLIFTMTGQFEEALEAYQTVRRLSLVSKNERWRYTGIFGIVYVLSLMNKDMDIATQYLEEVPPESSLIYNETFVVSTKLYALYSMLRE